MTHADFFRTALTFSSLSVPPSVAAAMLKDFSAHCADLFPNTVEAYCFDVERCMARDTSGASYTFERRILGALRKRAAGSLV